MNSSRLSQFCDRFLEGGWLLAVIITPVFFNVYSDRVFEPDKLTTLRALATVMAVVWLVRLAEELLQGGRPLRFTWRTPLVLPAVVTMGTYLISSLFSVVPYTSFVGSYQRLQGTYTLFGYLVLFFALVTGLRSRAQLSRLVTALILASLPVALYGVLQHFGRDPLPWAGDVQRRVASNMGNAIFVAAYLVMIAPLTAARLMESFRDILGREQARLSDIFRASAYIFMLAVQLLTIWWSRSRGPWIGIVIAAFLFPYLLLIVLQRRAAAEEPEAEGGWFRQVGSGVLMGFSSLMAALLVGGLLGALGWVLGRWLSTGMQWALYMGGGGGVLAFGAVWLYFVVERKGWRWLWIGWGTLGLLGAAGLLLMNFPGPVQERVRAEPNLRRMTTIFEWDTGTGRVRTLIWEGALDLVLPHEPLVFPDGSTDRFNALRPLVGYGPESMYVAYNRFYPPLLGHYESRNASPDRSHNETLDAVVITGVMGLGAYLFTFGSVFYWGVRWLGFIRHRREGWAYIALITAITLALFIFFLVQERPYFFAVAIPLGVLLGTLLFVTGQAFRTLGRVQLSAEEGQPHPHALLIIAIFAALMAHFLEINFGIAIASTRTVFWVLAGVLVAVGLQWIPARSGVVNTLLEVEDAAPASRKRRGHGNRRMRRTPKQAWVSGVLVLSLIAVFLLGTLLYDFVTNPERSINAGQILWRSLTVLYAQDERSPGALMILVFTWLFCGVIGLGEMDAAGEFDQERSSRWSTALALYAGISLFGAFVFGTALATFHARLPQIQVATIEEVVDVGLLLAGSLGQYYTLIFLMVPIMGWILLGEEASVPDWAHWGSLTLLVVLLIPAVWLSGTYSYDLIRADVVFKQGKSFAGSANPNEKQIGIMHYERALELAPREDYYYLFLGKAYLELGQVLSSEGPEQQQEIFQITEEVLQEARRIAPLNTDHSANLARFYNIRASYSGDTFQRPQFLQRSIENYHKALTLSPNNAVLWNELARAYYVAGQEEAYQETLAHSLALDPEFEQTWALLGEIRFSQDDIEGAIEAYGEAVALRPRDCDLRYTLASLQVQRSRWGEVEETVEPIFEYCPNMRSLWDVYRLRSIAAFYQGEEEQALALALESLQLAPESQRSIVEQLIAAIQQEP